MKTNQIIQKKQKLKPKSQDQGFLGVGYEVLYSLLMPMNGTFNFTFIKKEVNSLLVEFSKRLEKYRSGGVMKGEIGAVS